MYMYKSSGKIAGGILDSLKWPELGRIQNCSSLINYIDEITVNVLHFPYMGVAVTLAIGTSYERNGRAVGGILK